MEFNLTTRLSMLLLFMLLFAMLEARWPLRRSRLGRLTRWKGNLGLFLFDVFAVGLPVNGLVFAVLLWVNNNNVGIMNWASLPTALQVAIGFLALDAMFYAQHVLSHRVNALWRLHQVHHADTEMDVTTANRVHPFESLWLAFLRISLVIVLGIPVASFVAFLTTLNVISLFNHMNVRLPWRVEQTLRLLLVTPEMHETHHSASPDDFDMNFGFIFSGWDRLFGTHKHKTSKIDGNVVLGLDVFRGSDDARFTRLLAMPFRSNA